MFEAFLQGKLSREQENMEDILTSNIFGMFKYLNPEKYLIKFLKQAEDIQGNKPLEDLSFSAKSEVIYKFWPQMEEAGCAFCEPDVLITITNPRHKSIYILIESKYRSGKSSYAEEYDQSLPEEERKIARDQLAREWQNLSKFAGGNPAYLVYITADFGIPEKDISEAKNELQDKAVSESELIWLSWRILPKLFSRDNEPIVKDIVKLIRKMGLVYFTGFDLSEVENNNYGIDWRYKETKNLFSWLYKTDHIEWRYEEDVAAYKWDVYSDQKIEWGYENDR